MIQKEMTSQDKAIAETLCVKEIRKSLSKNPKFEIWKRQYVCIFTQMNMES